MSTFSIVAYDPHAAEWGVAVQSKFLAAAAVVSWAQAGAGAVATQSYANVAFGPQGLALMAQGFRAEAVLERLIADDAAREQRQVGIVDCQGRTANYTGRECQPWAGGLTGNGFSVQGNILVSGATVEAMAIGFEQASGELADRLVAALAAGQAAGGDRRGQQSAGVLVVRQQGGYGGLNDRYLDLRVDDDPAPIDRLKALVELHHVFFKPPLPGEMVPIEGQVLHEVQEILRWRGYFAGSAAGNYDDPTRAALGALIGVENLEERYDQGRDLISIQAVRLLWEKYVRP
jgi:uncharacterized Ntn-hydrolase superfamily protein